MTTVRVVHPRLQVRRGRARATTWWGKAWVRAVEESAYAESDLRTARTLARGGHVGGITVEDGAFWASVADGDELWTVRGTVDPLDGAAVDALVEIVAAESGRIAALVAGELPYSLVEHAEEAGVELLPYGGELTSSCSCEPWADPCPHGLAVLHQLAWLLEADPFVLFHLRGLAREMLLDRLHARRPVDDEEDSGPAADLDTGVDAAVRAARVLELLDDPEAGTDHLW